MKFEIKDMNEGGYMKFNLSDSCLIRLGNIWLKKEEEKNDCCIRNINWFNYHNISNALCGKNPDTYGYTQFTLERLLIFQFY